MAVRLVVSKDVFLVVKDDDS